MVGLAAVAAETDEPGHARWLAGAIATARATERLPLPAAWLARLDRTVARTGAVVPPLAPAASAGPTFDAAIAAILAR